MYCTTTVLYIVPAACPENADWRPGAARKSPQSASPLGSLGKPGLSGDAAGYSLAPPAAPPEPHCSLAEYATLVMFPDEMYASTPMSDPAPACSLI